jgi:hypothetical protein
MTTEPKWRSNPELRKALQQFQGNCSYKEYQLHVEESRWQKLKLLFKQYGLSMDKTDDAMKLVAQLAMEHITGFQIETPPSRKANSHSVMDDALLMGVLHIEKQRAPKSSEMEIIRALATENGWLNGLDAAAAERRLKTKWRRYQNLKKKASPEYDRVVKFCRGFLPEFEARIQELEKNDK